MKCPCIACHRRGFWRGRLPGEDAHPELQELAPRIAAAQIDRVSVQRARHQLRSRALGNPDVQSSAAVKMPQALLARGAEGEAQLLGTA
jgi:hypothetical protein